MTKPRKIRPQKGPQEAFCASTADIAIYGGAAFTGKSFALAYEAARYVDVPGYAAVIFRRTTPELQGGGSIWSESIGLYPHLGGVRRESPTLLWRFPSNATIEFRHLQHADTVYEYQGKQYAAIFYDEIAHFEASQFWYMLSRLRSTSGVPRRVRGTCNPDPDSFVRELVDWWIGHDGLAIEERSGVIRYLARVDERLVWGASADEVRAQAPNVEPLSFTFISAKATDNKIGLERDPEYLSRLAMLPGAERERLLNGNWNARDTSGDYFTRQSFPILDRPPDPKSVVRRVRFWDKAATSVSTTNPDPDWTRGALVALLDDDTYVLEDLQSTRAGPGEVEGLILHTARTDGRDVEVGCFLDPAQAGKVDAHHMQRLLEGYAFQTVPTTRHLTVYAKAWVGIAAGGRFKVVRGPYLHDLWRELEGYPFARHDDIVAAISGGMQLLTGPAFDVGYVTGADHRHPLDGGSPWREDTDDDDWGEGNRGGGGSGGGRGRGAYA